MKAARVTGGHTLHDKPPVAIAAGRPVSVRIGEPITIRPGDILSHALDQDAHLAGIPDNASTKGYFVNQLPSYLRSTRPEAYPEFARLHPESLPMFREVSVREALRRGFDVARLSHPNLPAAEALRRMGWVGYTHLLDSLLGKMLFGVVSKDLEVIYRFGPRAHAYVEKNGTRVAYTRVGDQCFRYDFDPCCGWLDSHQIGLIEGAAALCGYSTELDVHLEGPYHGSIECRWF